jgi:hypothetical protein
MSAVTKITFPGQGPGMGNIRVYLDGKLSGPAIIVGEYVRASESSATWTVHLWSHAGEYTQGDEVIYSRTLAELRPALLERIARDEKWWQP